MRIGKEPAGSDQAGGIIGRAYLELAGYGGGLGARLN